MKVRWLIGLSILLTGPFANGNPVTCTLGDDGSSGCESTARELFEDLPSRPAPCGNVANLSGTTFFWSPAGIVGPASVVIPPNPPTDSGAVEVLLMFDDRYDYRVVPGAIDTLSSLRDVRVLRGSRATGSTFT